MSAWLAVPVSLVAACFILGILSEWSDQKYHRAYRAAIDCVGYGLWLGDVKFGLAPHPQLHDKWRVECRYRDVPLVYVGDNPIEVMQKLVAALERINAAKEVA